VLTRGFFSSTAACSDSEVPERRSSFSMSIHTLDTPHSQTQAATLASHVSAQHTQSETKGLPCSSTSTIDTSQPVCDDSTELKPIKIIAWNVNGLRHITRKGFLKSLMKIHSPDIVCLTELKCRAKALNICQSELDSVQGTNTTIGITVRQSKVIQA
jgi:hypothetical protein